MKRLDKKTMIIIGSILGLIVVIILYKKMVGGKRTVGYWSYPDSSRIYYSDETGVVGFKGGNGEWALHRASKGYPTDFTRVDEVDVMYEENNEYYLPSDNIVLI